MTDSLSDNATSKLSLEGKVIATLAFLLGLFHIANVSGVWVFSTMVVRVVHLTMILCLAFLSMKQASGKSWQPVVRYVLTLAAAVCGLIILSRWESIAKTDLINSADFITGIVLIVLVILAALLFVGRALAIITLVFLLYPFYCNYLPGIFFSRGNSTGRIVNFLVHTSEGIYGIPVGVASTYIILFTIYGAFLSQFGAGDFFFKLARSITRGLTAASAKAAVLFSALLGMISGSAAGNVAVTGSFTIPMMKKEGYKPEQAAAIEAVVSTGGQIMPPVMGAAAFIMAEIIGQPYRDVMVAAIVPAALFFISVLSVVHLQAKRLGIKPESANSETDEATDNGLARTLLDGIPLIIPFVALIAMMVAGYSPFKACFWSILSLLVAQLIWHPKNIKEILLKSVTATRTGAMNAIPISIACAAAGIIAGILAVSGLGAKLSALIVALSGGIPLIALALTAITAIILGMGLPTTAAYLILATVIAPALAKMGVSPLTAHLFVFFFGCISTITPPVALASYVAAGIAGANLNQAGWTAFRYGLVCYLLPFMFFFGPGLIANDSALQIVLAFVSGAIGVIGIAACVVGYLKAPINGSQRIAMLFAGACLLHQGVYSDLIGLALTICIYLLCNRSASDNVSYGSGNGT